ncbi:uncharacterized protein C8A04DRAFT_37250 [Dichotomopilus funicola]|uniref:J domain-containing protein n=1 Tax=Dichotomopilus funicola TaxID=1934379 RepID=A0AAN6ZMR9_9PEZI|nr:hypothetical protein C8A04DRAFT_37250 [Dichotomopilus funicola]
MADQDLLTYAQDAASRGDDLFSILGTDATASSSDIRRAFRRKALTAHPDKAGDAYDPQLYERLERARDVLTTAEARAVYDNGMRALLQKRVEREQMSEKRRRLVEDLERREAEAAKRVRMEGGAVGPEAQDMERRAMAARGRAKMEEMRKKREEAEVRERLAGERSAAAAGAAAREAAVPPPKPDATADTTQTQIQKQTQKQTQIPDDGPTPGEQDYDSRIADLEKRLRESQQRKAEKQQRKEERRAEKKTRKGSPQAQAQPHLAHETTHTHNSHHPSAAHAEPQADEDRVSAPGEKTTTTKTTTTVSTESETGAGETGAAETSGAPKASDKFASTLARLRAAQAKREEEKRRAAAA